MNRKTKIITGFFLFIFAFSLFLTISIHPLHAQDKKNMTKAASAWFPKTTDIINTLNTGQPNINVLATSIYTNLLHSISITGGSGTNGRASSTITMTNLSLTMTQQPGSVSSVEYLADLGQTLGVVPKAAYAQGSGFAGMTPLLSIWKIMRDFAYIVYVIIFFIIGLMIMLRKKIDPRTVISIELALPKLVISLLLITFSYAIVGFIIDIVNLATRIIGAFFMGGDDSPLFSGIGLKRAFDYITGSNIFAMTRTIGDIDQIGSQIGDLFSSDPEDGVPNIIASLTVNAIFSIASIFITFKIFFSLLGPYVGIALSVIFAPFQLLLGAIPGSESSVGSWLKGIFAKAAVFPVAFFLILLAASFGQRNPANKAVCQWNTNKPNKCLDWKSNEEFQNSVRQDLNIVLMPLGNYGPALGDIIAFGILFTIPATSQLVQSALKTKDQTGDFAQQTITKGMSKIPGLKSLVS